MANTKEVVKERGDDYGHPYDNHRLTAELFNTWRQRMDPARVKPFGWRDVVVFNICQKLSRDAHKLKKDNWQDIAGYAETALMCMERDPVNRGVNFAPAADCLDSKNYAIAGTPPVESPATYDIGTAPKVREII